MAIRLTKEAKAHLERVLKDDLKYIRLSLLTTSVKGEMFYDITWTTKIDPKIEMARTARDWNVIVIDRRYESFFDGVLLGLDANDPAKVVVLENPNVLTRENGKVLALNE